MIKCVCVCENRHTDKESNGAICPQGAFFLSAPQMQVKPDTVLELLTELTQNGSHFSPAFAMPTAYLWDCFTW